jgi:hypothetical protein
MNFGNGADRRLCNSPDWLWEGKGQLLILSSPYIKGKHYASSVKELLGVVSHLELLHEQGYVHGDVRAYNIIFSGDDGHLIDFDIGGLDEESTKYPEGYNSALNDGIRRGKEGVRIRKYHDWRALIHVLFNLHHVDPPNEEIEDVPLHETEQQELQRLRENNRRLRAKNGLRQEKVFLQRNFAREKEPSVAEISRLKSFLKDIDGWNVTLDINFEHDLSEQGFFGDGVCDESS